MCVSGSDKDGHPAERSDRVRAVATEALARCPLVQEIIEEKDKNGEIKKVKYTPKVDPTEFYSRVEKMSHEEIAASARGVLASVKQGKQGSPTGVGPVVPPIHQRSGSLSGIVTNAFAPEGVAKVVAPRTPPKQISLYEYLTTRNPSEESMTTARPEPVGPVRAPYLPRYNFSQPAIQAQNGTTTSGGTTSGAGGYLTIESVPSTQNPPMPMRP